MHLLVGHRTWRCAGRAALLLLLTPLLAAATWCQSARLPGPMRGIVERVPEEDVIDRQTPDHDTALHGKRLDMLASVLGQPMPYWLQGANHKNPAAMRSLGFIYRDGLMRHPSDPLWGLQWLERAAIAGDRQAISMVGDHYLRGENAKPDLERAKLWYTKGYVARDARATISLAELYCHGTGVPLGIARCSALVTAATGFRQKSDAADVQPMLALAMFELGDSYRKGTGTAPNPALAGVWYARSAALKRPSAAIAGSKLYLEPGGLPYNLAKATAVLDSYLASNPLFFDLDGRDMAHTYVEIGAAFEKLGGTQTVKAIPVYRQAARMGYPSALTALAVRYVRGSGIPQDLQVAHSILNGEVGICLSNDHDVEANYEQAVKEFDDAARAKGVNLFIPFRKCPPIPVVAAATSELIAPPVQPRYPNMIAPNTVKPAQKFPVMVSLNTQKLDSGTTIVSAADEKDGQLMIAIPAGMTSILIDVNLVSPQMTSVDGVLSKTIELTVDKDSTTAVFSMQAGTAPGVEPMFATMSYNGAFLATIRRDVMVAVSGSPPTILTTILPPLPLPGPTPIGAAPASANDSVQPPVGGAKPPVVLGSPAPQTQDAVVQRTGGIILNPEARAPDITIQEIDDGDSIIYAVTSPLAGYVPPTKVKKVVGAQSRSAMVAALYHSLETRGAQLQINGGKDASQQVQGYVEGQGASLYDQQAPASFKTIYQKLEKLGVPVRVIEVLTDGPSLPWELMRPMGVDGKREDFLGLRVSVVHSTATATPRNPPPEAERVNKISVVMPQYKSNPDLILASSQKELDTIKGLFPALDPVPGTLTDVGSLARALPEGIVHFIGHGIRVPAEKGLAPDVGILLDGGTMVPATWLSDAENGNAHPFYFFNACDLGQSDVVLNYVDGWGPKLLESGASGYLGAMWKVSDVTAGSFSAHFYADLKTKLAGTTPWSVADVVTQARQETYAEHFDPTALAYVLYSAPYQTLRGGDATP